jgi:hypothetical protein
MHLIAKFLLQGSLWIAMNPDLSIFFRKLILALLILAGRLPQ